MDKLKFIFHQIVSGMNVLHRYGFIHRDLKPENILINKDNHIQLADFGLSRSLELPFFVSKETGLKWISEVGEKFSSWDNNHNNNVDHSSSLSDIKSFFKSNLISIVSDKSNISKTRKNADNALLFSGNRLYRRLSKHITTRWYRSPEVLLFEPSYSYGVDVWSLGCLFAELLMLHHESRISPEHRHALFNGTSSFITTDFPKDKEQKNELDMNQLITILLIMCRFTDEKDVSWIKNRDILNTIVQNYRKDKSKRYYNPESQHFFNKSLDEIFEHINNADKNAFDLLRQMLQLDPDRRIKSEDILKHPFFSDSFDFVSVVDLNENKYAEYCESLSEYFKMEWELEAQQEIHPKYVDINQIDTNQSNYVELRNLQLEFVDPVSRDYFESTNIKRLRKLIWDELG